MESNELVSIIIPCYNHAEHLEETVQSVLNQTYKNMEIIIINDGSTDNTEEISLTLQKKYPDIIHLLSQENTGVCQARNNGIKKASGQFILPVDADDLLDKTMISSCMKSMVNNNADIVYVDIQCFGVKNYIAKKKPFYKNNILYQNPCSVTSLYKKNVWEKLNGYNNNMKEGYEDWEFWINAFKHGFIFQHLQETLLLYRTQEISRDTKALKQDTYLKAKIILNHPELYTRHQVQEAISTIKNTERLPDLYFYFSKKYEINEQNLFSTINNYLLNNKLQDKQFIVIPDTNTKIGLYSLDVLVNIEQIEQLYKELNIELILFYSTIRYEIPLIQKSYLSWSLNKGITKAQGTIFPFVIKSKRENPNSQLIAYQRFVQYLNEKLITYQTLTDKQNTTIKNKMVLLQKKSDEIIQKNDKIKTIMNTIQNVIQFPIVKNPIGKYKAYKTMLKTYNKLQKD